ncbi:hypothetical protein CRE_03314 [Caenorhabditis remanei]|uniref:Uncharacterized protein n=1 Tax=Caenorhabditis remanei TaxID=31234 RepID=E3MML5_CAERE|nr:hypothetical protein CRE_03314 [Caenorhabditis remanei]
MTIHDSHLCLEDSRIRRTTEESQEEKVIYFPYHLQ